MANTESPEARSKMMSRIRGKDTSIEVKVRKYLFSKGFRYRKNVRELSGTPDIVLPKYRTVIFVNGCFWHRHPFCKVANMPKTNTEYWQKKFENNTANDKKHYDKLEKMDWHVIVIWECELKQECFEQTMQRVIFELEDEYVSRKVEL